MKENDDKQNRIVDLRTCCKEHDVDLPVGVTEDEFFDVMYALQYDNPEAFWWDGHYR